MMSSALVRFDQPQGAYRLLHPASWESLVREEGRVCGFGPRDRSDVGLWISIVPARVDTSRIDLREGMARILGEAAAGGPGMEAAPAAAKSGCWGNVREDPSLRHPGLRAESLRPDDAGRLWLLAGGDLVLFASSQLPESAREEFEPPFDRLMASLTIQRDGALRSLQITQALLDRLRQLHPEGEYRHDAASPVAGAIRGRDGVVFSGNLVRLVEAEPERQGEIIDRFIAALAFSGDDAPSAASLGAVRELILPVPKPGDYIRAGGPTASLLHRPWTGGAIVCYAIEGSRTLRFVNRHDVEHWGIGLEELHRLALANLQAKPFPQRLPAAGPPGGRVVLFGSGGSRDASWILHPGLHRALAPILGDPFLAGVPDRSTLVLFSNGDRAAVARVACKLRAEFRRAPYPVSPRPFLVTRCGIRAADLDAVERK